MSISADKILTVARGELGTKATPIKNVKYNTWYYGGTVSGSGYDWCEVFVQWVFAKSGAASLLYGKTASCGYGAKYFQDRGRLVTSNFRKGDIAYFHWTNERSTLVPGTYVSDHVGIVESVNADGTITTIEGNTGGGNGAVMRQTRSQSYVSCAGRPTYTASSSSGSQSAYSALVKTWQHAMNVGFDTSVLAEDGIFGTKSAAFASSHPLYRGIRYNCPTAIKWVQAQVGTTADGVFGYDTESKVKTYQRGHSLYADGIVGLNTTKKLLSV